MKLLRNISRNLSIISLIDKVMASSSSNNQNNYYRADGVRITHDPYTPNMIEKYGAPGKTDHEGFDPYRDTVGAGIYGGRVRRDPVDGSVIIGKQYQNHNKRPGPVYLGGGYAPIIEVLTNHDKLSALLTKYPDLANDVTTGGAAPLHMCGMSKVKQQAVGALVNAGADLECLDTYGMTPLHRMASNNLPIAGEALIQAGADPNNPGLLRETPLTIAQQSHAWDFIKMIEKYGGTTRPTKINSKQPHFTSTNKITGLRILNAGVEETNGKYKTKNFQSIPDSFAAVCDENGWSSTEMWEKLNGQNDWFQHENNNCYVYRNLSDGRWWIDGNDGLGVYVAPENKGSVKEAVPGSGWSLLTPGKYRTTPSLPTVLIFREKEM